MGEDILTGGDRLSIAVNFHENPKYSGESYLPSISPEYTIVKENDPAKLLREKPKAGEEWIDSVL